jgi:predicted transcriptional regulator of viral defense system
MRHTVTPNQKERTGPDEYELFELASGQQGYFTSAQALTAGYSRSLLSHYSKEGRFARSRHGVYRLRQYPSSPNENVMAAWLAVGKDSVVSHESALSMLRLVDTIPNQTHITVPRSRRYQKAWPGVKIHTTTRPLTKQQIVTREGLSITSPIQSILDFAESGGAPEQAGHAIAQALQQGLITRRGLIEAAQQRSERVERLVSSALAESPG